MVKLIVLASLCIFALSDSKLLLKRFDRSDKVAIPETTENSCELVDLRNFKILVRIFKVAARWFNNVWSLELKKYSSKKPFPIKLLDKVAFTHHFQFNATDVMIEYDNATFTMHDMVPNDYIEFKFAIEYGGKITLRLNLDVKATSTKNVVQKVVQFYRWAVGRTPGSSADYTIPLIIKLYEPIIRVTTTAHVLKCKSKIKNCQRQGIFRNIYLSLRRKFSRMIYRIARRIQFAEISDISLKYERSSITSTWMEDPTRPRADAAMTSMVDFVLKNFQNHIFEQIVNGVTLMAMKTGNRVIAAALHSNGPATCLRPS
uniref:AlNc14C199G8640 protein n=1 Tax=Albugo laibachii Nc14 TaxID=890382 RepID=F0WQG9_9STRA|nr:AlNc14C199G8640 [Albugo laibachii Nc14]|eukprot:CCA23578.1 AlNc14C199G8640 [Albugo laibachii Nc14]